MKPGIYNFGTFVTDDTVKARVLTLTRTDSDENTTSEDLTGVTAIMTIRDESGCKVATFTTDDDLSIVGNELTIGQFYAPKDPGSFKYDLELTFPDDERYTYLMGTIITTLGVTR